MPLGRVEEARCCDWPSSTWPWSERRRVGRPASPRSSALDLLFSPAHPVSRSLRPGQPRPPAQSPRRFTQRPPRRLDRAQKWLQPAQPHSDPRQAHECMELRHCGSRATSQRPAGPVDAARSQTKRMPALEGDEPLSLASQPPSPRGPQQRVCSSSHSIQAPVAPPRTRTDSLLTDRNSSTPVLPSLPPLFRPPDPADHERQVDPYRARQPRPVQAEEVPPGVQEVVPGRPHGSVPLSPSPSRSLSTR